MAAEMRSIEISKAPSAASAELGEMEHINQSSPVGAADNIFFKELFYRPYGAQYVSLQLTPAFHYVSDGALHISMLRISTQMPLLRELCPIL